MGEDSVQDGTDQVVYGTKVIGYESSEVLDVKPAEYFVEVTRREKRLQIL